MKNLNSCAVMLLASVLLLTGCGPRLVALPPGSLPALPALPASARQERQLPECSPTCSAVWQQKVDAWQRSLTEHGLAVPPANGSTME